MTATTHCRWCDRPIRARGLCASHYQQTWLAERQGRLYSPRKPRCCCLSGCPSRAIAKGLCKRHYARWCKLGRPENLSLVTVTDLRRCKGCGAFFRLEEHRGNQQRCPDCRERIKCYVDSALGARVREAAHQENLSVAGWINRAIHAALRGKPSG